MASYLHPARRPLRLPLRQRAKWDTLAATNNMAEGILTGLRGLPRQDAHPSRFRLLFSD